jgi:RimJ/RimL family protein N-acetyltransferase
MKHENINLQEILQDDLLRLVPLQATDFEKLYQVASDPLIWEQHPNKDRYRREVFATFFEGALESGGAYLILEKATTEVVGSSRFYDLDEQAETIAVGYTFIARKYWGKGINRAVKTLMLNHAFNFCEAVYFHIGAENIRSQKAIEAIGALKTGELEVAYYGEPVKLNFEYRINKKEWLAGSLSMPG